MTDPLDAFRRNKPADNTVAKANLRLKPYEAFRTKERTDRLEIRRVLGETRAPSYRYLMDIGFNGEFGTELVLYFSFLIVKIAGKNMQPLIRAIIDGNCAVLQDFHPKEFIAPAEDAPIITSVEYVTGKGMQQ